MEIKEVLKTFNKAVNIVMANPPGPARWRAANDLWLTLSPNNVALYKAISVENKQYRETTSRFGMGVEGKDAFSGGHLRSRLSIPKGAYYAIKRADPLVFDKENEAKFFKTFPEYTTRSSF